MIFRADAYGNITIDEKWFGMTLSIVRKGNGKEKSDSNFVSLPSESVMVDSYKLTVTFMANGEIYKTVRVYYGEEVKEIPSVPAKKDGGDRTYVSEWCSDEQGTPAVFTSIAADMIVYAVYTAYYNVTLESGTGYTLTAELSL